ncbi:MAG: hypothetical protein GWP69_09840 [Gammaproteobacteria bacterium]|nr:hypothetical protein [Gammaproteobacteria bacterium]
MSDEPQWNPEAALAAFLLMSILFAIAGLVSLVGLAEVELGIFDYSITSRLGNVLWVTISLLFAFLFGYLLRNRLRKR